MNATHPPGSYSLAFITDTPANLSSERAKHFKKSLIRFPEEAIYVYSFKENRMVYADGWEEVLGYKNDEITMVKFVSISAPEQAKFAQELNDKALQFIFSKSINLEAYSFTIELKKNHKNGAPVPVILRVGVFRAEDGKVVEIIGRCEINRSIKFGKVMKYAAYGPEKTEFEENLSKSLFQHVAISGKEKEALALVAKGYSFKEIAVQLEVSKSAIEKRIIPLYKRFKVRSLSHLISFALENNILP